MNDTEEKCGASIRGVAVALDTVVWFVLFLMSTLLIGMITGVLR